MPVIYVRREPFTLEYFKHMVQDSKQAVSSDLLSELVAAIRELQAPLTGDQRVAIWDLIREGYCTECGDNDPRCQCWNDE